MATLLLAEHENGQLNDASARALTAAIAIGAPVHVLLAGTGAAEAARNVAAHAGVAKVLECSDAAMSNGMAETLTALVMSLAADHVTLMAPATATGKSVMPRVAALSGVPQVSEIIEVVAPDTFKRPIYAGNAIQTVQAPGPRRILTVRTAAFAAAPASGGSASVETVPAVTAAVVSRHVSDQLSVSDRPELTSARIVVSGGRGIGSKENFALVERLADRIGGGVGASRAAVDSGYAPNDWQVGQTGKVIAPDLYVAVGISGAIQHLAGMKDSKVIVAINKDDESPIFQIADYGLVADLFEAVPALEAELAG